MKKDLSVGAWQRRQRPIMGHRAGEARCHNKLSPVFSHEGKRAFYSCQVCDWTKQADYPEPKQLELTLSPPAPPSRPALVPARRRQATQELLEVAAELRKVGER